MLVVPEKFSSGAVLHAGLDDSSCLHGLISVVAFCCGKHGRHLAWHVVGAQPVEACF